MILTRWLTKERGWKILSAFVLGMLPGIVAIVLAHVPMVERLETRGLDLLFRMRGERPAPAGVCVVALDNDSEGEITCAPGTEAAQAPQAEQPPSPMASPRSRDGSSRTASSQEKSGPPAEPQGGAASGIEPAGPPASALRCKSPNGPWPRALHADLVRVLKKEGARAIAYDILFEDPQSEEGDGALASAIAEAGNVILLAPTELTVDPMFHEVHRKEPFAPLAAAAAALASPGLPLDPDAVAYTAWLMQEDDPSLALAAYEIATGDTSHREGLDRYIDYYGGSRTVKTVSFYQALDPVRYLPPGFFKGKIVFIGTAQPLSKDYFLTPYRGNSPHTFGVEVHATIAANLLEGRRIDLLPFGFEPALLLFLPLLAVFVFMFLRPLLGVVAFFVLELAAWAAAHVAFTYTQTWIPVMIPSLIQLPSAYVLSLIWYYLTTARERERIRKAFAFYLSPEMIAKIVADPKSLNLGGEEILATALFTDIKGFTSISESMQPQAAAALLNEYFSEITESIFTEGGTLIKYIGDAVFAIWGAPLRMEDHAVRACTTALAMARSSQKNADGGGPGGVHLFTRIGVHTGSMLVGNLGSRQRFDYTAIGDAVNFASRLEGLNKYFGTTALTSAATIARTNGAFLVRPMGRVRVVGKTEAVEIFELLGRRGEASSLAPAALARFEAALADFGARRFETAAEGFRAVKALCGEQGDGPSDLFLRQSLKHAEQPPPADWDGAVTIEGK